MKKSEFKLFDFVFRILGAISPVHIWFVTMVTGARKVGCDNLGNCYYEAKARPGYFHPRRWVIYAGEAEPSAVPAEWHGWLHYQSDYVPSSEAQSFRRSWQKPSKANLTGTPDAYHPPGHLLAKGVRDAATGDYEPWVPVKKS